MKRIINILIFILLCFTPLFAEKVVPVSALPKKAQTLLGTSFSGIAVTYAEKDDGEYEVQLSDGTEAVFSWTGSWKKIDGKYKPLPDSLIPPPILDTVKKTFEGAQILSIEKKWNRYEIQLNSGLELFFNSKGSLLGQKYDD